MMVKKVSKSSRLLILLLGILISFTKNAPAAEQPHSPKKILFICTGNYYRSRFAEAVFNYNFGEGKTNWTAFSRGFDPSSLTPKQREFPASIYSVKKLDDLKIPQKYIAGQPTQITQDDLDQSDLIVAMHQTEHEPMFKRQFPSFDLKKVRFWEIRDGGKGEKDYDQVLQMLYEKTLELGKSLKQKHSL